MKKSKRIISLAIFALTLLCSLILLSFGYEELTALTPPNSTTQVAFVVYKGDGTPVTSASGLTSGKDSNGESVYGFVHFVDAAKATKNGYTIKMVNDYEEDIEQMKLSPPLSGKNVTLDLNGHTWSSIWTTTSTATTRYERIVVSTPGYTFKVTGSGTVRTSTSFVCISKNGNIVIDPGEGNCIDFIATSGYKYVSDGKGGYNIATSVFTGDPMLKIGGNRGSTDANLTVRGNITYKTEGTNCNFIGLNEGAKVTLENAVLNADLSDSNSKSIFAHIALSKGKGTDGVYYSKDVWHDFKGPTFIVKNSVINSPYGKFIDLSASKEVFDDIAKECGLEATFSNRDSVVIEDSKINLNGNGKNVAVDFNFNSNVFADIRISDSDIVTDALNSFNFNAENQLPNTVVILKNTTVDTSTYGGTGQCIFNKGGTVVVDGGELLLGQNDSQSPFLGGYAWTTKSEHTATEKMPDYANAESALYDPTVGGYGHLIKEGTVVTKSFPAGAPGILYKDYKAFIYENNSLPVTAIIDYKGHPATKTVVTREKVNYETGGINKSAIYTFENAEPGEYKDFSKNLALDNAQFIVTNNGASRPGLYNIVPSPTQNNKYLTHSHYHKDNMAPLGAYISIKNAESPTASGNELYSNNSTDITSYSHYALDLDLMSPNANPTDGTYIQFSLHSFGIENATRSTLMHSFATVYIKNSGNSVALYSKGGDEAEISLTAGKWVHMSIVLAMPTDSTLNPDISRLSDSKLYVYINGEYVTEFCDIFEEKYNYKADSEYYYNGSLQNTYIDEVRIGFPTSDAQSSFNGEITCFDNIMLRNFAAYDGEIKEIADFYKRIPAPENLSTKEVTVRWEDGAGNLIEEKKITSYTRIANPTLEKSEINDYYAAYPCWFNNGIPIEGHTYAPTEDTTLVKGARVKANFSNIYYNISLDGGTTVSFYLPCAFVDGRINSIKFDSLSAEDIKLERADGKYNIGDAAYYKFSMPTKYTDFDKEYTISLSYEVIYSGKNYTVSRNFKANALLYCKTVIDDTEGIYSEAEKTHIANLVRFINQLTFINNKEYSKKINELYNSSKDLASEYETDLLANGTQAREIGDYVKSINIEIKDGKAGYVIAFDKNALVNVESITVRGKKSNEKQELGTYEEKNVYYTVGSKKYCSVYTTEMLSFDDFFKDIAITLHVGSSEELVYGFYSPADWIESFEFDESSKKDWSELLCAMKELGDSAE